MATLLLLAQAGRWLLWRPVAGLPLGSADFAAAFPVSLRFDLVAAAYASTPLLLAALLHAGIRHEAARTALATFARRYAFIAVSLFAAIGIANFAFFQEYRDQFNAWVFGAIDDDLKAVAITFLRTFHWGRYLLAFSLCTLAAWAFFRKPAETGVAAPEKFRRVAQWGIPLGLMVIAAGCYRGGYARRPISMKDAYVCADETANRLVPNPAYLLRILVETRMKAGDASTPPDFVGDVRRHAQALEPGRPPESFASISALITQTVRRDTPPAPPPRHVYLIVMESYDRWAMTPPFDRLGLTPHLTRLAAGGAISPHFVSSDSGTMVSLAPMITGIPPCDLPQNYQPRASRHFPTSIAPLFKKLGYKTRLAYGGYGAWQRISDFAREQGFDEVVTGAAIDCPEEHRGEWGVPDAFLFNQVARQAEQDDEATFTLVLSTSYHPPYAHALEKLGCPPVPAMPPELGKGWDGQHSLRTFSHLRYADKSLGEFVDVVSARRPDSVFAITGDHWSRKFLNTRPDLSQRKEVPFVLYSPAHIPAGTTMRAGTHADIVPTLLHLIARDGFSFPAFGTNLLAPAPEGRTASFACDTFVHDKGLVNAQSPTEIVGAPLCPEALSAARRSAAAQKALGWWLLMRGDELPAQN